MSSYDEDLTFIVSELNRSSPLQPRPARLSPNRSSFDQLLGLAAKSNASDILLVAGSGVALRIQGQLSPSTGPALTPEDIENLILSQLDAPQQKRLQTERTLDVSSTRDGVGRIRINLHYQRGTLAAAIRLLPAQIPTVDSLQLPATLNKLAEIRHGLILVTGASGSGKSSTLAAMVGHINAQRRCHIVTIEDPIEYHHTNQHSLIEQMEIGADTVNFAAALRAVLRQNPDVILVGEMRDEETIAATLSAAETGHLVLSTLHTNDAPQAISRILDSFSPSHQQQVRQQLSLALTAVISQQLVPALTGLLRYPAVEIMTASSAIRNLIRKGEEHQLLTQISMSRAEGMMTMEQSLAGLVRGGKITRETALAHCFRPADMQRYLNQ